jgi:hypothetical protein
VFPSSFQKYWRCNFRHAYIHSLLAFVLKIDFPWPVLKNTVVLLSLVCHRWHQHSVRYVRPLPRKKTGTVWPDWAKFRRLGKNIPNYKDEVLIPFCHTLNNFLKWMIGYRQKYYIVGTIFVLVPFCHTLRNFKKLILAGKNTIHMYLVRHHFGWAFRSLFQNISGHPQRGQDWLTWRKFHEWKIVFFFDYAVPTCTISESWGQYYDRELQRQSSW